tara:strand:- start:77240 stop:79738 length:2499 start_codon:yes stop_codon:yes gene_type:complete
MNQPAASAVRTEVQIQSRSAAVPTSSIIQLDFFKIAWSAKWLLLLGTTIGLGAGYFAYTKSTPMYRSAAKIQIIDSAVKQMPVDQLDSGIAARNLNDEMLVLRSEHLLLRAAEIGELKTSDEFGELSLPSIATLLSASEHLVVGPATDAKGTSIFSIQFDSPSPETSQRVTQAIVDAYEAHLRQEYRNVGQEAIDLIQAARIEVAKKLEELEAEFANFRSTSELVYRGDEVTSVHRDNADKFLMQTQSLLIRRANLAAVISSSKRAIHSGMSKESVLIALRQSTNAANNGSIEDVRKSWEIEKLRTAPVVSVADQMRQEALLPLELERQTLVSTVGLQHPAIDTIDRRIEVIRRTIQEVAKTESERRDELDQAMTAAEEMQGIDHDREVQLKTAIQHAVAAIQQQMSAVDDELRTVTKASDAELAAAKRESAAELKSAQMMREIERQQQLYDRIMARLDEVNLMSGGNGLKLFPLNNAKLGYQVEPSLAKCLLMGGFAGWMLAAGLALLCELSDRSYRSAGEIVRHTRVPVIGHVPVLKAATSSNTVKDLGLDPLLCTFFDTKSPRAEAFRSLRTAVYFSNQSDSGHQVLQVTSAAPSEGKTTVACNLAIAMAQSGRSVLLLDADMRRPRVGKVMNLHDETGTSWALEQATDDRHDLDLTVCEAIHDSEIDNLSVMPAGARPDNPAELLSSRNFDRLLSSLRKKFDLIIIDSPPLLVVSDPANIAPRVDGVLLVVRLRKNIKPAIAQATRMLETLQANVLGVIVNGVGSRAARGYGKSSGEDGHLNDNSFKGGYGYAYGNSISVSGKKEYDEYHEDQSADLTRMKTNGQVTG